jgi:hypothetical protein
MVTVFVKNGCVYRFPSHKVAELWLAEHPEEYGHDITNLDMFSPDIPEGSLELEGTLSIRCCNGCGSYIKFTKSWENRNTTVICPACETVIG